MPMPVRLKAIFYVFLHSILILMPAEVIAEKVAIPVFFNYPQLQLLMKRAMFTGPDFTARYSLDNTGCNTVAFSEPHLSAEGERLR